MTSLRARELLPDFPHPYRSAGPAVFCAALGIGRATLYRFIAQGLIEKPRKVGTRPIWTERYIAKVALEGTSPPDPLA